MTRAMVGWFWVCCTVMIANNAQAQPVTYKLVPDKCRFVVHLLKDGLGARLAHDHLVRAKKLSGRAVVDPKKPHKYSILVDVDAKSLTADEPWLRKKYGMDSNLSASDRTKVERNMKAENQLNVARFPTIRFASTHITPKKGDRFQIYGKLTIRGKTKEVSFPAKATIVGNKLKASGSVRFNQSDFGYKPYSAAAGLVKVKDKVTLNIYLEGKAG